MLLLLDDTTGKVVVDGTSRDNVLAGAVLLDLVNHGRVGPADPTAKLGEGKVVVLDVSPTGDPVLDHALARLGTKPVKSARAVELLQKGTRDEVLEQLVGRGLLRREDSKVLGLFPRTSWPAADSRHEEWVRQHLDAALLRGAAPEPHTGALVSLLHAVDAVPKVVAGDRKELKARAKEIAQGEWAGAAVKKAVADVQAVLVATVVTTTVVTGN